MNRMLPKGHPAEDAEERNIQGMIGPEQIDGPVQLAWKLADGHMALSTAPGLGVIVDEKEITALSAHTEELGSGWFHASDNSVADW